MGEKMDKVMGGIRVHVLTASSAAGSPMYPDLLKVSLGTGDVEAA